MKHMLRDKPPAAPEFAPPRPDYLNTLAAQTARAREFARLGAEVARLAVAPDPASGVVQGLEMRRTPTRCMLQFGPVALTLGWIRSADDSIAAGQLLAIVWRGVVGSGGTQQFERPESRSTAPASALWERTFAPHAESEATWEWHPQLRDGAPCSSAQLAALCVAELRSARHVTSSLAGGRA